MLDFGNYLCWVGCILIPALNIKATFAASILLPPLYIYRIYMWRLKIYNWSTTLYQWVIICQWEGRLWVLVLNFDLRWHLLVWIMAARLHCLSCYLHPWQLLYLVFNLALTNMCILGSFTSFQVTSFVVGLA